MLYQVSFAGALTPEAIERVVKLLLENVESSLVSLFNPLHVSIVSTEEL